MIRQLVQQVFVTGVLSTTTETLIRQRFNEGCDLDELDALIDLQQAVMFGHVKRESTLIYKPEHFR